jgi:hypothetical protein
VHFVALLQQKIRKITSVLASNAGDQCFFHFNPGLVSSLDANTQLRRSVLSTIN